MQARILVCDDEAGLRRMLGVLLRRAGFEVNLVEGVTQALERIGSAPPYDLVVTDLIMPDGSGMDVLEAARRADESTQIVMITAYATTEQAVEAMRKGAYDYIQKPFRNEALLATLDKALEKRAIVDENRALRAKVEGGARLGDLVCRSDAMQRVMDMIVRVGDAPTSVLLTGESGSGKEMVARALHAQGARKERPFVAVNCGALPEALMESELFGHEKGAFTGATSQQEGLFRAADGGTIFLDEVAELPPNLQVKLLRVLQDHRVRPVGSQTEIDIDVRVIAATNRGVEDEVAEGRLREDLYYRLNVIHMHIPPLRERPADIPALADAFLRKHAALQKKRLSFAPEAARWLAQQPYRGNVRELENVVERAVTLATEDVIGMGELPQGASQAVASADALPPEGMALDAHLEEVERRLLLAALARCDGVRTQAAKLLGMSFRSFRYRLDKYGIGDDEEPAPDQG